ncbi:DUF3500 domain-containing protein [Brevifollis gellanilyticus]|uniref:DUF3500 domain-containing protein n=1 Tax=Brevifollis gellanilyticus TaxID=748831 RepID=UPI0011BF4B87|nr:DUF3500 domain-containing protein [Brevifollis gellanilyticus]
MNTPLPSRRRFLQQSSQALAAGLLGSSFAEEGGAKMPASETLVQQLYGSLDEGQRSAICLPWEDPLRLKVDNNWHIRPKRLRDVLKPDQQDIVRQIFDKLHSDEYKKEVWRQFDHDNQGDGGFASASVAIFGTPGSGKFEFVLTGRHCTRRCDGDSEAGTAFGGPIFYGHAAKSFNEKPDHEGNAYWFQAKRANELFQALDGKQRELALCDTSRDEEGNDTVKLTGKTRGLDGIPVADLTADQKGLVRGVLKDLLAPFRAEDATESMKYIEAGGFDNLHLAYYKNQDLGKDSVWDVWQVEGPNMVWFFRGEPHVHCWAHIKQTA